jgi:gluconolactonase
MTEHAAEWRSSPRYPDPLVRIIDPDGQLTGRIDLPERCANLCFGGLHRNRLFMAASTSLHVNTQGVAAG